MLDPVLPPLGDQEAETRLPEEDGLCQQLCAHVGSVGFVYLLAPVVRSFLLRFLSHGVLLSSFHVHPCLFASRALELVSAQFLLM